jgi:hypothetical protein
MSHVFKHPKYYTELRKLRNRSFLLRKEECTLGKLGNKSDQAISSRAETSGTSVRPDPGLKQQATSKQEGASNQQSTSSKAQATSLKP